jgi:hypothetical protein
MSSTVDQQPIRRTIGPRQSRHGQPLTAADRAALAALAHYRLQLEYSFTVEDAGTLTAPLSFTATWDHRPDLQHSGEVCDPAVICRAVEQGWSGA